MKEKKIKMPEWLTGKLSERIRDYLPWHVDDADYKDGDPSDFDVFSEFADEVETLENKLDVVCDLAKSMGLEIADLEASEKASGNIGHYAMCRLGILKEVESKIKCACGEGKGGGKL